MQRRLECKGDGLNMLLVAPDEFGARVINGIASGKLKSVVNFR